MDEFTQAPAFISVIVPMDAEILRLHDEVERLARTIGSKQEMNVGRSKSRQIPTRADERSLERAQRALDDLESRRSGMVAAEPEALKCFNLEELVGLVAHTRESDPRLGGIFSNEERTMNCSHAPVMAYEGRWEREIRIRLGLDPTPTLDHNDTPYGEVKFVGKECLLSSRQGGRKHWGRLFRTLARTWTEDQLSAETWSFLEEGEVSVNKVYVSFDPSLRSQIQQSLVPSVVLGAYNVGIFCAVDAGYIHVPASDYDLAFSLYSITRFEPKYRLRREYVENLLRSGAQQGVPDQVAVDPVGQHGGEPNPIALVQEPAHHGPAHVDGGGAVDCLEVNTTLVEELRTVPQQPVVREVVGEVCRV
jgi:hypothetical protein